MPINGLVYQYVIYLLRNTEGVKKPCIDDFQIPLRA